jgi:hypothetical protein
MFHDVWRGWQLQHGRVLSRAQASHQNDLPIGKLQRIMMRTGMLCVDLTEPSHFLPDLLVRQDAESTLAAGCAVRAPPISARPTVGDALSVPGHSGRPL